MKTLIKNGIIVDGTKAKGFKGDLAIEEDLIVGIGQFIEEEFDQVIDAQEKVVSPGFIDTHSHSDLEILINPYLESKIRQGITTEVLGQDGISMAPLPLDYVSPWRKNLAGLDGDSDELSWDWQTTDGYLQLLEGTELATNLAYLVPHGNIRMEAMGLENCQPDAEQIERMKEVTRRALEAGVAGLSTGLIYMPCAYGRQQELIELCKVVAEYDRPLVIHQRSEADDILNSMAEVIKIGEESGVKIHFSHFKVCGKKNWDKIPQVEKFLEEAQAKGLKVSFDQYPYAAGSTMLGVTLPPWVHDGGTDKLLERLEDEELREQMIADIESGIPGWDNFIDFAGFENIYITSVKTEQNRDCIGKNLIEIAQLKGKDPYHALFDLLYEEENAVGMYDYYGREEDIIRFMKRPEQNFCTDGLLGGRPHPRVYGSFPKVLGKYVREEGVLTLEEAIYKMTAKAAEAFGFDDRGTLEVGKKADLLIFNPATVSDKATFIDPIQYSKGIELVMVNGELILQNGQKTNNRPGAVIRLK